MDPNPQSALPLPSRSNLEYYRKQAKSLLKAHKSGEPLEDFARKILTANGNLASAQFVVARLHGFESWPKFSKHIEALSKETSPISNFEAAADAIVAGDVRTLKRLLRVDPQLVHAVSTREHGASLLHYVAANGVENYRQKTPPSIVEITKILLDAGAAIDATADVYGGGCTTLGLAATSVHPELAGVQEPLLQILLDHGASLNGQSAGNRHSLLVACFANGRPKAAEFLASRGAPVNFAAAAGLGHLDVAAKLFDEASAAERQDGFLYACAYGRNDVVEFLARIGADLAGASRDGQTALHWAVIGGHPDTVSLLLRYKPPLEAANVYGGTAVGQTLWSAAHGADPDVSIAILELLAAAGAKLPKECEPINARVDEWLAKHG